MDVTEDSDGLF